MVGLTLMHLSLLHVDGSTNPLSVDGLYDFIPFYPYFLVKDVFGFLIFLFLFSYLVFFEPNLLGHPDNYIRANPLVTPAHIVPEWYFLPFYAILRAVPSKLGGVVAMGASIGILFLIPALDRGNSFYAWLEQYSTLPKEFNYPLVEENVIELTPEDFPSQTLSELLFGGSLSTSFSAVRNFSVQFFYKENKGRFAPFF